jgi:LuxR family maltose regulon positive regulatory protein
MSNRPHRQGKLQTSPLPPPLTGAGTGGAATTHAFFLRTKLLPPRPTPALLQRPRLMERLASNLAHPVTLVAANAGSGKTTLVADFVRTHARPFVWYQLDRTDADPFVFLGYLAHGIKQVVPEFGAATLSYLQQSAAELAEQPERAVDVFLNEVLDLVDQQLIFVLDDYHHLGTDTAVHRVVDRLLAYLPDVLHIIIISRDVPPLALARLRAHNELTIIDRAELLFTDDETQELFRQVFDLELTPEQLAEYRERTHGWITALQLIRQVAQRQALARGGREGEAAARPDLSEILRQSELDIFDYFAEEVFADEAEDTQQLLLRISLLDRVEAEVCGRLYPDGGCSQLLPALVRRNVFMTVAGSDGGGEEYRLHPLFKDFLSRRLRSEIGQMGVAREHLRCADFFVERKQWEQAIRHLLAAEEFTRAAIIIAHRGQEWIATGAFTSLIAFVEALPEAAIEAHPRALLHRAEVARLRGEYETSQMLFRRAATLLHGRADAEGEAEALHSLATIARRRGDYTGAFKYLDRALELVGEKSSVRVKCGNTRGLCYFAMAEWAAAEGEFRAALQLAEKQNDTHYMLLITHNLGTPAMIRGDFSEAMRWLRRMLGENRDARPMPREASGYLNLARCHLYRGDLDLCEEHLDHALERCQLFNLLAHRAEAYETYGNLYRERGDAPRAAEFYGHAARDYEAAGVDLARSELWEEQAILSLQTGDAASARSLLERLIEARSATKDEMALQTATLAHARVAIALGLHAQARAELEPAILYFHTHGLHYYEAQASLALAACALAEAKDKELIERLRRALDLAARYDYDYWLRREVAHHPQLFAAPDAAALLPPDIREGLQPAAAQQTGASTSSSQQQQQADHAARVAELAQGAAAVNLVPPKPAADLTINMLGPVEIFRDPARPLAADAWTTKRARDILCFIASRRHRRASKDTIIDTFWGEADFDAVEKNFHPTVSHIRKALNSNQPVKQNFLLYRDSDYLLNQEFPYRIDTEEFDRLVAEAEAAKRAGDMARHLSAYEEALALYRGDFMQGSYDEWVEEQRSYYREQYLRMLEVLAVAAQKQDEWSRSLQLAQQILGDDQFREDVHCMIMRAHAALGNRAAVKDQYEHLRRVLRKELGVEPAAETQKIFKGLMS